jgi:transcriptional regulator with XRE-family HTH domain
MDQRNVQEIIDRAFAGQDMLEACERRDLGAIIRIFRKYGITQGTIASLTGIAQGRLSEYKTGKRVPSAKSTFEAFANGLNMPDRARRALGLTPLGASDGDRVGETSGLLADTFDLQLLAEAVGRRGTVLKRRELLTLAGSIGAAAAIAQNEVWERVAHALSKPSATDDVTVREIEARSAGFHQLEEWVPASALYKGLAMHLREVGTLLNASTNDPNDELRARLIASAGESAVLAGWLATDMGDMAAARSLYETAERAAKELDDPGILACALAYRSYIPSTKGAHGRSRALLTTALDAIEESRGPTSPGTMAWLAARHAEESAALGDKTQALNSWGKAEEAFNIADPEEDRVWTRFLDQNRFDSYRIATYAKIGKLEEAQESAQAILSRLTQPDRKKAAIILEDIAAAHVSQGSINEACRLAKNGLAVLRETEFTMWLPRFEVLAQSLRRYQRQTPVREFLEDFSMTKHRFAASAH